MEKINSKQKFQKMWEAHATGTMLGELVVAFNISHNSKLKEKIGVIEKNIIFFYKKGLGTQFFYKIEEMKEAAEFGFKRFTNKKKVDEYIQDSKKAIEKTDKSYEKFLDASWKSGSVQDLLKIFKKLLLVLEKPYSLYYACQPQYFAKIENYLIEKLEKKFDANATNKIYSILTLPEKLDSLVIEELEWLKIVRKVKEISPNEKRFSKQNLSENIISEINKHSDQYVYLGDVEAENPWNFDHYIKLLNKQLSIDVSKKIKDIESKKAKLKRKKLRILGKYDIDDEAQIICDNIAKIGINRLALRFAWTKAMFMYIKVLREIAKRNFHPLLNSNTILEFKINELEDIILNNKVIPKEEIKRRKQSFLYYSRDYINDFGDDVNFYSGEQAIKKKQELIPEEKVDVKEFDGSIACKGKIVGKVFLFTWLEENLTKKMDKMQKGDILVAGQTRPFLMLAIRKAGGIITDEGGITSHAAIVSRELNIPCIIGTKIATKVLKDGDLVEVDANKGVIKIIEK